MLGYESLTAEANELYFAAQKAERDFEEAETNEDKNAVIYEFSHAHAKFVDKVREASQKA